jgi:hypothetical protein
LSGDDQRSRARELERELEIRRVARLVGVDEDQVERPGTIGDQRAQRLECGLCSHLDDTADLRPLEVGPRDFGVVRVRLDRDHPPVRGNRPRQPDRAVAGQRAQLEHGPCADRPCEQVQQLPLERRDFVRRQPRVERGRERGVGRREPLGQIALDCRPAFSCGSHVRIMTRN